MGRRRRSQSLLAERCPAARIDAVEPNGALLARSEQALRGPWWRRLRSAPAQAWTEDGAPAAAADMVWANMVLHRVADPARTIARWHDTLAVDGFLMFSTLGPDTLRELRTLYATLGWGAPAQEFVDMHDIGDALVQAGLADPVMDMERLNLSYADAGALLAELRALGGNAARNRQPGLRTPRWRARLEAELEQRLRGADGRLHLSFELVYGHAFKPLPRVRVAPTTTVGVDGGVRRGAPRADPARARRFPRGFALRTHRRGRCGLRGRLSPAGRHHGRRRAGHAVAPSKVLSPARGEGRARGGGAPQASLRRRCIRSPSSRSISGRGCAPPNALAQ